VIKSPLSSCSLSIMALAFSDYNDNDLWDKYSRLRQGVIELLMGDKRDFTLFFRTDRNLLEFNLFEDKMNEYNEQITMQFDVSDFKENPGQVFEQIRLTILFQWTFY
jgi:hypothetical protein